MCNVQLERWPGKASHLFIDKSTRLDDSELSREVNKCFRTPCARVLAEKKNKKNKQTPKTQPPQNHHSQRQKRIAPFFSFLFFKQKMQFCWTSIWNKNDCKVIFLKAKCITVLRKNLEKEKAVSKCISTPRRVTKKHTWVFVRGQTDTPQ